ncbi:RNA polymerase sigma-70 factor [Hymenobacter sp. GOD-10R]|uniref:RNA polymerase sigma-70 factor n=1 Tax=Hymenobacter sp. GOD-10R TaxID=3093922 RepID=UPI002D7853E2|nr:RNA polymerase sigma-70 factor [Hymenobacter sp. GOD-10R]WRQ29911.1 RNA polymerase sigma-70 factor [Hymenobacter sp. GOD-10R]
MKVVKEFSDHYCLERLQQNDTAAFDMLFDQHAPALCRFVHGYLKSHADAEEVVQDCFLKLWERRHEFDQDIVFKTYLYTSAYRAILKQLRRQRYWVFEDCDGELLIEEGSPSKIMEYQEMEELYQLAVAQLPSRRRQIFALSRQQGLSHAMIAKELNISVKCVENQMTHALKFLKLYFQAHGMSLALVLILCSL